MHITLYRKIEPHIFLFRHLNVTLKQEIFLKNLGSIYVALFIQLL